LLIYAYAQRSTCQKQVEQVVRLNLCRIANHAVVIDSASDAVATFKHGERAQRMQALTAAAQGLSCRACTGADCTLGAFGELVDA
jgi:hypothetical protein